MAAASRLRQQRVNSVPWELSQISELARAKDERRRLRDRNHRLLGHARLLQWLDQPCKGSLTPEQFISGRRKTKRAALR